MNLDKARLRVAITICAALLLMEAAVLLAIGDEPQHRSAPLAVTADATATTLVPAEEARAPVALTPERTEPPTTAPPSLRPVRTPPASLVIAPAAATRPAPATTIPPDVTTEPPTTGPALPACQPSDVAATTKTDQATYRQGDTVTGSGEITNVSGHDCAAPVRAVMWCDGAGAGQSCISALGPISAGAAKPWPAGETRRETVTWALAGPADSAPANPGMGTLKFTWYLGPEASGPTVDKSSPFEITAPAPATTTSTSTTSTTVTTSP